MRISKPLMVKLLRQEDAHDEAGKNSGLKKAEASAGIAGKFGAMDGSLPTWPDHEPPTGGPSAWWAF